MDYSKNIAKHYNKIYSMYSDCAFSNKNVAVIAKLAKALKCHLLISGKDCGGIEKTLNYIYDNYVKRENECEIPNYCGDLLEAILLGESGGNCPIEGYLAQNIVKNICQQQGLFESENYINSENAFAFLSPCFAYAKKSGDAQLVEVFASIISIAYTNITNSDKACSNAILNVASGLLSHAEITGCALSKSRAIELFTRYLSSGMTLNYEGLDFVSQTSGETNPSVTASSFVLAIRLYKLTGDVLYRTLARRIWFNGLQFCLRHDGSVGKNSGVKGSCKNLRVTTESSDEHTLDYALCLLYYNRNKNMFADGDGNVFRDGEGRFIMGDKIFALDESEFFGSDLIEIPPLSSFDRQTGLQLDLKIIF